MEENVIPLQSQSALEDQSESQSQSQQQINKKLQFPILLVKMKKAGDVKIDMSEDQDELILTCSKQFEMMNENHVFEALGLTTTNAEELSQLFSEGINQYLKNTQFIERKHATKQPFFRDSFYKIVARKEEQSTMKILSQQEQN